MYVHGNSQKKCDIKRQLEFGLIYYLNRDRRRGEKALMEKQMTFRKINEPLGK